jgi:hypothetical protein
MATATDMLRQGDKEGIWRKYCGFLDLGIKEYMSLQRGLLERQMETFAVSALGTRILKGNRPKSLDDFRKTVPFTTYKDYADCLLARNEAMLPEKPFTWVHTSGRSGEYEYKWVPYTRGLYEVGGDSSLACLILSAASRRGDVALKEGMTFPYLIAPPPYLSGVLTQRVLEIFNFISLPPLEKAVGMGFQERIQAAFGMALSEGLDFFFGVTSILLRISESFGNLGKGGGTMSKMKLTPKAVLRIVKALAKKIARGGPLLPKYIWSVKGAMCGGMDTSIFKKKVVESWGIVPLEVYASTEMGVVATQTWSREGLTFFPEASFWEFIKEEDYRALMADPSLIPTSYLMDEVLPGADYVLVGTNLHGGALIRYILGDLVRIVSREDLPAGVLLPQMTFTSRIDDVIDIGSFTRLTEKTVWRAIEGSGVPYEDWCIRKESDAGGPVLHLYIELRDGAPESGVVAGKIHESLRSLDAPYKDLETIIGLKPLSVTVLSKGTFRRYLEERQAAGADLAHLKPPHVNASDTLVENLLRMSAWKI